MTSSTAHGDQLPSPPADGVTALCFAAGSSLLLASSWDGTLRLYDAEQKKLLAVQHSRKALLDCAVESSESALSGGLTGTLQRHDFSSPSAAVETVGVHGGPVSCVEWLPERRLAVTAGWDSAMKLWDPRQPQNKTVIATLRLPGKAYSMSAAGQRLVVATSDRQIIIYDIRNMEAGQPLAQQESALRYQTRCIRAYPNGTGFAIGSVEGRVALEFYDPAVQAGRYAFKCHRRADSVFPVNAIAFHPGHGTFATGGCDGVVSMWDGGNKKRLWQTPTPFPSSIAALAFSDDGRLLAIASSYTFEQGDVQHPPDAIYVRSMGDHETQPKVRQ